jgi:MerR family transcriptional regulator, light-induced transcriptional regulator
LSFEAPKLGTEPLQRIGAVSNLTGIPVSTLRIWEIRYAAFSPIQTAGKHRLYGSGDVKKAGLLKKLSEAGHAIRTIARLPIESLELLARQTRASTIGMTRLGDSSSQLVVAVVGSELGVRIDLQKLLVKPLNAAIELSDTFVDLGSALTGEFKKKPEILIVKINTLNASSREQIDALNQRFGLRRTIVLYNYAPEALIQAMRRAGMLLRRLPITEGELSDLVSSEIFVDPLRAAISTAASIVIPDRQYTDAVLARVAGISTSILCECPKHVAELISQLASFEEYSQECLSNSVEDAHLHAYLRSVSGSARAMFERALEMVAQHEGISLLV